MNTNDYIRLARSNLTSFGVQVVSATVRAFFQNDPYFAYKPRTQTADYDTVMEDEPHIEQSPLQIYEEAELPEDIGSYPVLVIVKGPVGLRRVSMDDFLSENLETGAITRIALAESIVTINCFGNDRLTAEYLATEVQACFHFYSDLLRSTFKLHDIEASTIGRSQTVMGDRSYQILGDMIPIQVKISWPYQWSSTRLDAHKLRAMFISFLDEEGKELHTTDP